MKIEIENYCPLNVSSNDNDPCSFPFVSKEISYHDFFMEFIYQNRPCLIQNICKNWDCSKNWITYNKINFDYLNKKFGNCKVLLYNCQEKYFNSQKTEDAIFSDFLEYWNKYISKDYDKNMPLYYMKDWHLKQQFPLESFYEVPYYFASDWINEYLSETSGDDYCFVYMGPRGSWTPFHSDVFSSFSWSANICGKKRWILYPPGSEENMKDKLGNLPYDVTSTFQELPHYDIIQNTGDAIFIPSGWYHQVYNLEDTISVNHNWINGCNIKLMWCSLSKSLVDVKNQTRDVSDMDNYFQHCQVMLKSYFGINFEEFYEFLSYIAQKRVKFIKDNIEIVHFERCNLGFNHAIFDLLKLKEVLELAEQNQDFREISKNNCSKLLEDITSIVNNVK